MYRMLLGCTLLIASPLRSLRSQETPVQRGSSRRRVLVVLLTVAGLVGCDQGLPLSPPVMVGVFQTPTTAVAGTALTTLPSVRITTGHRPIEGEPVTFTVTSGGGTITGAVAKTGPNGVATVGSWTMGPTPGSNVLTATSRLGQPVSFTVISIAQAGA